jgi:hypothetical protein
MRANRTSGSMRRGEKRVMVHSANGHRTRKGGHRGAPPDLHTNALAQSDKAGGEPRRLPPALPFRARGPEGISRLED